MLYGMTCQVKHPIIIIGSRGILLDTIDEKKAWIQEPHAQKNCHFYNMNNID